MWSNFTADKHIWHPPWAWMWKSWTNHSLSHCWKCPKTSDSFALFLDEFLWIGPEGISCSPTSATNYRFTVREDMDIIVILYDFLWLWRRRSWITRSSYADAAQYNSSTLSVKTISCHPRSEGSSRGYLCTPHYLRRANESRSALSYHLLKLLL